MVNNVRYDIFCKIIVILLVPCLSVVCANHVNIYISIYQSDQLIHQCIFWKDFNRRQDLSISFWFTKDVFFYRYEMIYLSQRRIRGLTDPLHVRYESEREAFFFGIIAAMQDRQEISMLPRTCLFVCLSVKHEFVFMISWENVAVFRHIKQNDVNMVLQTLYNVSIFRNR